MKDKKDDYLTFLDNIKRTGIKNGNKEELLEYNGFQFWSKDINLVFKRSVLCQTKK